MSTATASPIESVLVENRVFPPPADFAAKARISGMEQYKALCAEAENDYQGFWARLARENVVWSKPFTQVLDDSNPPFFRWFADGELNASANCLDKHMGTDVEHKTAIIFEADGGEVTKVSYRELLERVSQFANALKAQGVQKGDRVLIYMPMTIEGVIAMQACARIGATHSVVFGGFSAKAVQERIVDVGRRGRDHRQLPDARRQGAAAQGHRGRCAGAGRLRGRAPCLRLRAHGHGLCHDGRPRQDLRRDPGRPEHRVRTRGRGFRAPAVSSSTPAASTGKPKGVQHCTGGYVLWAKQTMEWTFDLKPSDVFWCTADIGWITGHTYVAYGPLAAGATQIVFEGVPTFPNAGRFWQMIERHGCTIFYTAPTAIRSLIKAADGDAAVHPKNSDLSSLRLLGSVGEPINPEAWMWYHRNVGGERCPIVDTFWQTENGGHVIAPMPGATPLVPGSCTLPLPGIMAAIVDETGHELPNGAGGLLVVTKPWPSMIRTIWGDPERFKKSYFPAELGGQTYLAGDGAVRSEGPWLLSASRAASTMCSMSRATAWARWRSSRPWCPRPTWWPRPPWWAAPMT